MRIDRLGFLLVCCALNSSAFAQKSDFQLDSLYTIEGERMLTGPRDLKASTMLYCDGSAISIQVEVKDDIIDLDRAEKDHLELWIALPPSSYPANFPYQTHPSYVQTPRVNGQTPPRYFSPRNPDFSGQVRTEYLANACDYPTSAAIVSQKMGLPPLNELKSATMPFGIVCFALDLDKNQATQLGREWYKGLQTQCGLRQGELAQGIKYAVEYSEDGYVVNIQVQPRAMGFLQLPMMAEIRFAVDVIDVDYPSPRKTVVSTAPNRQAWFPATFTAVKFNKPLQTNVLDIPTVFLEKTGIRPLAAMTDSGWVVTYVGAEMLMFRPERFSQSLVETAFRKVRHTFIKYEDPALKINAQLLLLDRAPVYTAIGQDQYFLIEGQVLRTELAKPERPESFGLGNRFFRYADGKVGFIAEETRQINPYGWGNCGTCLERSLSIWRFVEGKKWKIVTITQGENPGNAHCEINREPFPDFRMSRWDWVAKGSVIVFLLDSRTTKVRKRLKVSWDTYGNNVRQRVL